MDVFCNKFASTVSEVVPFDESEFESIFADSGLDAIVVDAKAPTKLAAESPL